MAARQAPAALVSLLYEVADDRDLPHATAQVPVHRSPAPTPWVGSPSAGTAPRPRRRF
ncbi:hypothetical protein [Kibdelosporangium philippinense]|uniref:hypothetical protein n=1 Tax=Kibdelosporangium philippinense TaxID=211113 RepID=UPI00360DDE14